MSVFSPCGSVCSQIAEKIFLIATLIYLYNILGYRLFTKAFFRQLVYVFQTIRIFLILAGILPPLLHKEVGLIRSGAHESGMYPLMVVGAFLFTLILAGLLNQLIQLVERSLGLAAPEYNFQRKRSYI